MFRYRMLRGVLSIALLTVGCDADFSYRPLGWNYLDNQRVWTKRFADIELTTDGLEGLSGSDGVMPDFEIRNHGNRALLLEKAALRSSKNTFAAELPAQGAGDWRIVQPGASRRISLQWKFETAAIDALQSQPRLTLSFREGNALRHIEIMYARE
jgi:hypothetical protein